jgi:4-hydroxy-3-methylbut-2-enyl diphosphate reductase
MKIRIEEKSGFCYGVIKAVDLADSILDKGEILYSLGQIVHNETEVKRLEKKGLKTISHTDLVSLQDCKMLIRAHGEPPSTYEIARQNRIELIDGTCPIVRKIQSGIASKASEKDTLIVIFGKKDHPEVQGLFGQSPGKSIVIQTAEEAGELPFSPVIHLYSQTTMDIDAFQVIVSLLKQKQEMRGGELFTHNTICGHVSHRKPGLQKFAKESDVLIFVGGKLSSNGKVLFEVCKQANPRSHFIGDPDELKDSWFEGIDSVGIAGATSTPRWQIEMVAGKIRELTESSTED